MCKDTKDALERIADILTQLLQTEDAGELSLVQSSLLTLCRMDLKGNIQDLIRIKTYFVRKKVNVAFDHSLKFVA